jgi:hypothetical protein
MLCPAPAEDRVALGWPKVLGTIAQAIHYRLREIDTLHRGPSLVGAAWSLRCLPTPTTAILARYGEPSWQLQQRYRLALGLALVARPGALAQAVASRRACCVTNRVLAQAFARMCGDAAGPDEARRQLKAMLLLVAPDKLVGLEQQAPEYALRRSTCCSAIQTLLFFRGLLDDPQWSAAIFAPGRLAYGQTYGPLGNCVAATFSALAMWACWAFAALQGLRSVQPPALWGAGLLALGATQPPCASPAAHPDSGLRPWLGPPVAQRLKRLDGSISTAGHAHGPTPNLQSSHPDLLLGG